MDDDFGINAYAEMSSDGFVSDSSEDELNEYKKLVETKPSESGTTNADGINLYYKLIHRENSGHFSGNRRCKHEQRAFNKVPNRLCFCLKDIVPYCYLQGHMFMGLSACGQYLLSYKVCCNENTNMNSYYFNFGYKYTLYFWIYRPHQPLSTFFKRCLFDDHGVDNIKNVTIIQWKTNHRVLVVHGAAEDENEDSYLTYVKVPNLGCLDCRKLRRDYDADGFFRSEALCIKCNLTIHTKYSTTESDPKFNPHINLISPDRIVIIANGFIHMLRVDLEQQSGGANQTHQQIQPGGTQIAFHPGLIHTIRNTPPHETQSCADKKTSTSAYSRPSTNVVAEETVGCDNKNNIVARIIADFSDIESETQSSAGEKGTARNLDSGKTKNVDELIFTCGLSSNTGPSSSSSKTSKTISGGSQSKVSLLSHKGKRNHRIVTKSYRNGVGAVNLQETSKNSNDKSNAYEFSEENEKCEKIATFRKRRLADKKYEFSEDNSENIIPFMKIRTTSQKLFPGASRIHRTNSHFHSPCVSPSYSSAPSSSVDALSGSVHHGYHAFRSPCGSPVGNNMLRSPNFLQQQKSPPPIAIQQQVLNLKPLTTLSPLQISMTKRNYYEIETISPVSLSLRDETNVFEVPLQGGFAQDKPVCTMKLKRRYVEEDDAGSVITSEEDDCISPGYHTSLPMEVHGSCYSDMQMISQSSYQNFKCPSVVITQYSFDLETFSHYVISNLCQKNNKNYDVFYDWAYELINVCPYSNLICCLLMAHFTANDQLPDNNKNCLNCSRNIDCVFHRRQFECKILFTWDIELGDWNVIDYGELREFNRISLGYEGGTTKSSATFGGDLSQTAKSLAQELAIDLDKVQDLSNNLRVLDSNTSKSKSCITDIDNAIEFTLKRPRYCD